MLGNSYVYLARIKPCDWSLKPYGISLGTCRWTTQQSKFCYILSLEKCASSAYCKEMTHFTETSRSFETSGNKEPSSLFNRASSSALSEPDLSSCQYQSQLVCHLGQHLSFTRSDIVRFGDMFKCVIQSPQGSLLQVA